jgi:tetratricopeptide (TPR) repeat protein
MPGKQARVLCPVCQEPIPPDETECGNCGAFVIDEAVVRLSRAFGLDRERALKLFEAGFRHPKQLRDRDPNRVLEKGEVGLLFICTNCGGFVASGDSKCPRCAAEFESEAEEAPAEEEDILDLVLCPVCGADNDPDLVECEICGEALREMPTPKPVVAETAPTVEPPKTLAHERTLENVDAFLKEADRPAPSARPPVREEIPVASPRPQPRAPATPSHREAPVAPQPTARSTFATRPVPRPAPPPPKPTIIPSPKPSTASSPTPRLKVSNAAQVAPSTAPIALETRMQPLKVTTKPALRPATSPSASRKSSPVVRKKVRAASSTAGLGAETDGGLVLAAAASLLLAGALRQPLVTAGIAAVLIGLATYQFIAFVWKHVARPVPLDMSLLACGVLSGLAATVFRAGPVFAVTALALGAALPFAAATRRLLRKPGRALLAVASAIPIAGQALVATLDPAFQLTIPWIIGIAASMPWPAALAATEILRRQSANVLRRQLVRAERNVERKDYERSLAEYDRAIAAAHADVPGAEIPWYGKGATLVLLGRYEEAIRAIDTALDINPRNEIAWVNKGNALTRLGRLIDALRCFNAAIKVNPLFEVAWNNKGNALARLGKFEDALRCYDRALEIDPGYRGAWVNMGFVLTKMGRFDEAASCADHALVLDRGRHPEPA